MRLEDLDVFVTVAKHGNLHRAAEALGLTQSALSKALARLEAETGMQLVERTPRGVVLTRVGASLQRRAATVLISVHDMKSELEDQRTAQSGLVRIGALPHLISSLLSPLLARFFTNRPLATFSIESQMSAQLVGLLQDGHLDLILSARPAALSPDLEQHTLGPLTIQIVARAGHPRRASFRTLGDLCEERWALPAPALYLRQWVDEKFVAAGLPPPRVAVESTASPVAFAELLRQSDLLGILPPRVLQQAQGQGLQAIEAPGMSWDHELAICWRREAYLSPICRDFRDAVVQWCGESGV
jgi:DNA-binding transcriptional LysR family regulator